MSEKMAEPLGEMWPRLGRLLWSYVLYPRDGKGLHLTLKFALNS